MSNYVIYTDSACDLSKEFLSELGVPCRSLCFRFEGEDREYDNYELSAKDFYDQMRAGGVAKTAAVNNEAFKEAFKEQLEQGLDVLYIGFSSGLSTTYNSARIAAEELLEEYPDRKVLTVDTLAASAGQGMLVALAVKMKNEGASIDEVAKFVEDNKLKLCHWFTVDDLVYLKRGGRVSAAAALVGGLLGIKPVLHVDDEGHLINMEKVRGRKAALSSLADKYGETADDKEGGLVYISHGDCEDDANTLASILNERYGAKVSVITNVGPVIGAHSGPGTLALFYVGSKR